MSESIRAQYSLEEVEETEEGFILKKDEIDLTDSWEEDYAPLNFDSY